VSLEKIYQNIVVHELINVSKSTTHI